MIRKIIILVLLVLVAFGLNYMQAISWANGLCELFNQCGDGGTPSVTAESGHTASELEVMLAKYFHDAVKSYALVMYEVEKDYTATTPIDCQKFSNLLQAPMEKMENANWAIRELISIFSNVQPNLAKEETLSAFNYIGFRQSNNMVVEIYELAKLYLKNGDFLGICYQFEIDTASLHLELVQLKSKFDNNTPPGIDEFWRVNQDFNKAGLFGQYTSQILRAD